MIAKYLAYFVLSGLLTIALPISVGVSNSEAAEVAGADEGDRVTGDQFFKVGQVQLPAPNLKMTEPKSMLLTKPAPQPQPKKKIDKAKPKPKPRRKKPVKRVVEPTLKRVQPAKRATEPTLEVTPTVNRTALPEPDERAITAPYFRMDVGFGSVLSLAGRTISGEMTGEDLDNFALFGVGLGYKFSENFRVDVTADYRSDTEIYATTPNGVAVSSEINGLAVMVNGYYDVGRFNGFFPYVGGSFGLTRLETAAQTGTPASGETSYNIAWALSLGSAIDVMNDKNIIADVSYRLVSLGEFAQEDGATYNDFKVHEFRIGFRHQF